MALVHFSSSCVAGWPCAVRLVPGDASQSYVSLAMDASRPTLLPIYDHREWQACKLCCVSWASQWRRWTGMRGRPAELRFFVCEGPDDLVRIAARSAYWALPKSWLELLAKSEGWDVSEADSEFSFVFACIRAALNCSEEDALQYASARFAINDLDFSFAKAVMEIDAAIEVLDHNDHGRVESKQTELEVKAKARKAFVSDYSAKKVEVSSRRGAMKGKGNQRRQQKACDAHLGLATFGSAPCPP